MSLLRLHQAVMGQSADLWTPDEIFAVPGTTGYWHDPYDPTTLFQDSAGTIPVTSDGDPIGLMLDKSGNGIHAYQTISGSRPTWKTAGGECWINTTATQFMLIGASAAATNFSDLVCVMRASSTTTGRNLLVKPNSSPNANPWGRYLIFHSSVGGTSMSARVNGTEYFTPGNSWPGGKRTLTLDTPAGQLSTDISASTFTPAALTYPNSTILELMPNFLGNCYASVAVGRPLSSGEKSALQAWVTAK